MMWMAAVVNHLHFKDSVDAALFARAEAELTEQMRSVEGFEDFFVVQTSDTDVILVILGDDVAVLDRIATEVGSPWMIANVVPLLAGPPDRYIGATIASSRSA